MSRLNPKARGLLKVLASPWAGSTEGAGITASDFSFWGPPGCCSEVNGL